MRPRSIKFGVFFLVLLICLLLIALSQQQFFSPVRGAIEKELLPLAKIFTGGNQSETTTVEKLKAENQKLQSQLVRHYLLVQENQAFRDQYAKSEATAKSLLPATVLSHRDSDKLLIDQGSANGVKNGQAVVLNDQLVGVIIAVTPHTATVRLVISKDFSVATQTVKTNALGVSRGAGEDGIVLQNVLLSDTLERADFAATKGEKGLPPNLIVGRIISIDKKASSLYQTAKVESLIDFKRLRTIFVLFK